MKTNLYYAKFILLTFFFLIPGFCIIVNAQTQSLEFASGAGNPTGNGITLSDQVITFQNNSNNPSGNNFVSYTPTLKATFSLSNQQYTLPTSQISTGKGLSFGANLNASGNTASSAALFQQMNSISSPSNSHFTSSTAVTPGTGIDVSANRAVELFTSAKALYNASASTNGRHYFANLTITFNQPVTNPIIHLVGLGGYYSSLGFTTELELQGSSATLSKLSGSNELNVSSTKILNSANNPNSNTGSGAASGSVLVTGSGITALTFRIYMRGDGDMSTWGSSSMHAGDVWLIAVSLNGPVDISGTVYNDANGLTNNKVDGTGKGIPDGTQLYANLLSSFNDVLTSVAVNSNGTYTFANVACGTNYIIQVSSNQGVDGQPAPVTALPANWVNTGENLGNGTGNDGSVNGLLSVAVSNSDITNANFGIEKQPDSDTKWYGIPTPLPNSLLLLNNLSGSLPGPFSGNDQEDGILGSAKKVGITSLPTGGNQLWYNGVQITKGVDGINPPSVSNPYIINSYVLSLLAVKFTGIGSSQTVFNYSYYDAADMKSISPASYTIYWGGVLPVKLLSFTAVLNNNNSVGLKWTSVSENNLSHYIVEKSFDGKNFSEAGIVFAMDNGAEKANYSFNDNTILSSQASIIWYRLRSVDIDGKSELSEVKIIRTARQDQKSLAIAAYPNPVSTELRITLPYSWQGKKVSFVLTAQNGQVVSKTETIAGQTETINVSKLPVGFYIVKVTCGDEAAQQKIIRQ